METILAENKVALLKAKQRFIENIEGFFEVYKFYITLLIITAILDAFSTFCFMYVLGVEFEIHPMVRGVSSIFGPIIGPFLGGALKVALGIAAIIYIRKFEKHLMLAASIFYSYAFIHNLRVTGIFNLL
jgi:hypothetical protein